MIPASPKDDRYLPGNATKRMVRAVRQELKRYGIAPVQPLWRATWEWAAKVAGSYLFRATWPASGEIACQYVVLLLATIKNEQGRCFKLPFRAGRCITPTVAAILPRGAGEKLQAIEQRLLAAIDDEPPKRLPAEMVIEVS